MMQGIMFDNIHSYTDLNLIPSKIEIPPATPKTTYIDIPGADGSVDVTEATGEVRYKDRECKFTFTVMQGDPKGWEDRKTEIGNLLNGKVCKIILDKDPDYYYYGRCGVNSWASSKTVNTIVIEAKVRPYKFKLSETVQAFDLSETPRAINIINARRSVCPYITCTDNNTAVKFGGRSYVFSAGTHKILDIRFVEGINRLEVSGSGTITFRFQEGVL